MSSRSEVERIIRDYLKSQGMGYKAGKLTDDFTAVLEEKDRERDGALRIISSQETMLAEKDREIERLKAHYLESAQKTGSQLNIITALLDEKDSLIRQLVGALEPLVADNADLTVGQTRHRIRQALSLPSLAQYREGKRG